MTEGSSRGHWTSRFESGISREGDSVEQEIADYAERVGFDGVERVQRWPQEPRSNALRENFVDDAAVDIREAEVASAMPIRQAFMIDAELVENRRLEVVYGDHVFSHVLPELVAGAVDHAATYSATGEPRRIDACVVATPFGAP